MNQRTVVFPGPVSGPCFALFVLAVFVFIAGCTGLPQPPGNAARSPEPVLATPAVASQTVGSDWCAGHEVPESKCTQCNPELITGFKASGDWCAAHDFPESVCPSCNPQQPPATEAPDWCAGHEVPESKCTQCNPELITGFKASGDWCAAHDFPESVCPSCNPQQPPTAEVPDWCLEHALPESMCTRCNPGLQAGFQASGDWCTEHGFPESACPKCQPMTPPAALESQAIEARIVRLARTELEKVAGIQTELVRRVEGATSFECTARVAYHQDRVAELRVAVPGIVRGIHAAEGALVSRGAPLFTLESAEVGNAQAALLIANEHASLARINLTRKQTLFNQGILPQQALDDTQQELAMADARVEAARAALRMTGAAEASPSGQYNLVAPIAGTLVHRPAVLGLSVLPETPLATLVDTTQMWVYCDVPEQFAARLAPGQEVHIFVAGQEEPVHGRLGWIASEVDPKTRMVSARVEASNPQGRLRANQFARARIQTGPAQGALAVPRIAIQRMGQREVVFVRTAPGTYEPRVVTRSDSGPLVPVAGRLKAGDEVVTTGAVLLLTEIMPGSIGAGCCEAAPGANDGGGH